MEKKKKPAHDPKHINLSVQIISQHGLAQPLQEHSLIIIDYVN